MASYRSPNISEGLFETLGTTHVHIDGAPFDQVQAIVDRWFQQHHIRGEVDSVLEWTSGPQRTRYPEVYTHHTSGEFGTEFFSCFSTMLLDDHPQLASTALQMLSEEARPFPGAVLEVEEVFATIDEHGVWREENPDDRHLIVQPSQLGFFQPPRGASIEVHHGVDIESLDGDIKCPLPLPDTMAALGESLQLGGLFRFDKQGFHAVSTNSFQSPENIRDRVQQQYCALTMHLDEVLAGRKYQLRTLIERVTGILHIDRE